MKPRLLIYGDDPETGGAAAATHRLALGLAQCGRYEVVYAVTRADEARIAEREQAGVRHRFIPYDTMKAFYASTRDRTTPAAIYVDAAPDLVLFADSAPDSAMGAKDVAAALGIPYVAVKHMVLPDSPWTLAPWVRGEIARVSCAAACVVAVSQASCDLLRRQFDLEGARMRVVPNSRPDSYFSPRDEAARARLRAEWGVAPGQFVVATVARMLWLKGHELIVWVAHELARRGRGDRFRFVWIGDAPDGPHRDRVLKKIDMWGGRRFFIQLGGRDDVPDCLDAADALLVSSLSEGMPLSAIEAMARGLPVVGTNVGGVPEAIGDCGSVVPSPLEDAAAMVRLTADALDAWAADQDAARALGARARARAQELFSESRHVAAMREIIDQALYPRGDYVSPGLAPIRGDRAFPFLAPADKERLKFDGARAETPHTQYIDGRDMARLLLNRDEAVLLHNLALACGGGDALAFGGESGWAAWHAAAAGMGVDLLELRLEEAATRAALLDLATRTPGLRLHVAAGAGAALRLAERDGRRWRLAVFNRPTTTTHDMMQEVEACRRTMADDAAMVFCHAGTTAAALAQALPYLRSQGWRLRLYDTAEMMAAAWRGRFVPPEHRPDPAVAWTRPAALAAIFGENGDPENSGPASGCGPAAE